MLTRSMTQHPYEVQQFTGYSTATNPKGQWVRGQIVRQDQVEFRTSTWDLYMYDPTNPLTWNDARG